MLKRLSRGLRRKNSVMNKTIQLIHVAIFFLLLLPVGEAFSWTDDLERDFFEETRRLEKEYKDFEKEAYEELRREVKSMWCDFITSTRKDWVEYSEDKTGRSRVDFKTGEVQVEVLVPVDRSVVDPGLIKRRLTNEIERIVVDRGKRSDFPAKRESPPLLPYAALAGQLEDKHGNLVSQENKKQFAQEVLETKPIERTILNTEKGRTAKARISFSLVPDHIRIRAAKYIEPVRKYSSRFKIQTPLVFAVIHTESYFNPKATSSVPAFGLMQLVPESGGRDAYRYVYGHDRLLPRDYLYDPENNIELGCAYLGLLKNRYFREIQEKRSALYCVIASYNTGAGNLSRSLCGNRQVRCAVEKANRMNADELFEHLTAHLPYEETRDYLKKVSERMSLYREWE